VLGEAGLQGLSRLIRSGRPVKALVLNGQSWRQLVAQPGLGGDGAAPAVRGGMRPQDLALTALGHQSAYVLQGGLADIPALLEGFLAGMASPHPAVFSVYAASLPPHGQANHLAVEQSRLALLSRAHPALRYDPDGGEALHERLSLAGNVEPESPWLADELAYLDENGREQRMERPLTFADYAVTVPELRHHFQPLPPQHGGEGLTPIADYLELDEDEQAESRPTVWTVNRQGQLRQLVCSPAIVRACSERRSAWALLRALTREDIEPVDTEAIARQAREETADTVWRNLVELARDGEDVAAALAAMAGPEAETAPQAPAEQSGGNGNGGQPQSA